MSHFNYTSPRIYLSLKFYAILSLLTCFTIQHGSTSIPPTAPDPARPNIIVIFMDDLGYGDLSSYGHPTIHTPNLDNMARVGQQWMSFYTASSVCSPSRGALLTGRYPIRLGLGGKHNRVFFPDSYGGLPLKEITIAEMLKANGYQTAIVGKWHLGHEPEYLPTRQGFDYYYGIPYSNDMDAVNWSLKTFFEPPDHNMWKVPLMENETIIERPANQFTITKRYTEKAVEYISENTENPFFLFLSHSMVHTPLFASKDFQESSIRGLYGDVMNEIDWSVGQILSALKENGIEENTLVVFTSDNGPWLMMLEHGGSAGLLRDGKGTTWEGGMRVPGIFYMPGTVQPGIITDMGSTLDILPTVASMTGSIMPQDREIDGVDLSNVLKSKAESPRDHLIFYRKHEIYAARFDEYKAHFITETEYKRDNQRIEHDPPLLFNLDVDPSEKYDHANDHPDVLAKIFDIVADHKATVKEVPSELDKRHRD